MEGTPIFLMYAILLIAAIVLLVLAIVQRKKIFWIITYALELVSMVLAFVLTMLFDSLPPTGIIPGLTYFAETLFSMGAVALFAVLFLLSVIAGIVTAVIRRKQ